MHPFPHLYSAAAVGSVEGDVTVKSPGLPPIRTAAPAEFGGPGDRWSPETFFMAAVADCYILTFRALARAAKVQWSSLACEASGTLDRIDRQVRFTTVNLRVRLEAPEGSDREAWLRLLEKAESTCLVTNSLTATRHLQADVQFVPAAEPVAAWHQAD